MKNYIELALIILAAICFIFCCFQIPTWIVAALYWAGVVASRSIGFFKKEK